MAFRLFIVWFDTLPGGLKLLKRNLEGCFTDIALLCECPCRNEQILKDMGKNDQKQAVTKHNSAYFWGCILLKRIIAIHHCDTLSTGPVHVYIKHSICRWSQYHMNVPYVLSTFIVPCLVPRAMLSNTWLRHEMETFSVSLALCAGKP